MRGIPHPLTPRAMAEFDADAGPPARDLVVVGASAGGIEALRALVAGLPADYPGALCVVCHTSPHSPRRSTAS